MSERIKELRTERVQELRRRLEDLEIDLFALIHLLLQENAELRFTCSSLERQIEDMHDDARDRFDHDW